MSPFISLIDLKVTSKPSPAKLLQNGSRLLPPGDCSLLSEGTSSSPSLCHLHATLPWPHQGMETLQQLPPCTGNGAAWSRQCRDAPRARLPKGTWDRDQCALHWNAFHARNNSNKQKILREIQRGPPKSRCSYLPVSW